MNRFHTLFGIRTWMLFAMTLLIITDISAENAVNITHTGNGATLMEIFGYLLSAVCFIAGIFLLAWKRGGKSKEVVKSSSNKFSRDSTAAA